MSGSPFVGDVTPEEILVFMQRPNAADLIDQHRIHFVGSLADTTRIGFVLDAAAQAVPDDPHFQQLSTEFARVIKEQTHALIKGLRAQPEVPEKSA